ncbi:MAG: hypothetical protein ACP5OS_04560 [Leptospirillia bacterium]
MADNRLTIRLEPELHEWLRQNGGENMSSVVRSILDDVRMGKLVPREKAGAKPAAGGGEGFPKICQAAETFDLESMERLAHTCESLDISLRRTLDFNQRTAQQRKFVRLGAFAMGGVAIFLLSWSVFGHPDHGGLTTTAFHQISPPR